MSRKLYSWCVRVFADSWRCHLRLLRVLATLAVGGIGTPALAQYITLTGNATANTLNLQIQIPVSTLPTTSGAVPLNDAQALSGNINNLNSALQITLPGVSACGTTSIAFGTTQISTACPLFATLGHINPGTSNANDEILTFFVTITQNTPGFVQSAVGTTGIEVAVTFAIDGTNATTQTPPPTLSEAVYIVTDAPQLNSVGGSEGSLSVLWTVFPDVATSPETENGLTHPFQPTQMDVYAIDTSIILPGQTVELPCLMFQGPPATGATAATDPAEPAGCTLTMPITEQTSGPTATPCVTFPNSGGSSKPDYLNAAGIIQNPVNGVTLMQANYATGIATVSGLTNGTNYLFFLQNEPQGSKISQCFFATPQPNFSMTELNGEGAAKIVDFRCFIATAAYGSPLHPKLKYFRKFRDHVLLTNGLGKSFVHYYYKYSPPAADFIAKHPQLRAATRAILDVPAGLLSRFDDDY